MAGATTMPAFAVALHSRHFPLVTVRLPQPLRELAYRMAWPRRQDASELQRWVRAEISQLVAGRSESGLLKPPPRP